MPFYRNLGSIFSLNYAKRANLFKSWRLLLVLAMFYHQFLLLHGKDYLRWRWFIKQIFVIDILYLMSLECRFLLGSLFEKDFLLHTALLPVGNVIWYPGIQPDTINIRKEANFYVRIGLNVYLRQLFISHWFFRWHQYSLLSDKPSYDTCQWK